MIQLKPGDRNLHGRQVRLITQDNEQAGIVTFETAIARAQQAGLDLVLLPSKTQPPVTRIMDYGKYLFEESKRAREARKNQVQPKLKEVKLRPVIDENDLNTKLKHAREFLLHGDKVRLLLQFRGREMSHQEIGMEIMNRFIKQLEDIARQDSPVRQDRKTFSTTLSVKAEARAAAKKEAAEKAAAASPATPPPEE
ncbi:MAG: translation initiation factor IF-3 [Oligosphaeraceae bacterium]